MTNKLSLTAVAVAVSLTAVSALPALLPGPQAGEKTANANCTLPDQDQAGPAYDRIVLVHRFTIPAKLAWGKVSVKLVPEAWHVGGIDGPPANAAQLRGALRAVGGLEVGGRCTGWVDGLTAYPCGYAVRELGLVDQGGDRLSGIAMDWSPDPVRVRTTLDARSRDGQSSPLLDTPRFVGLRVAPNNLGEPDKLFGRKLEFEIRAISNQLMPSVIDHKSGLVAFCGAGQKLAM